MSDECTCFLAAPCHFCLSMTEEEVDAAWNRHVVPRDQRPAPRPDPAPRPARPADGEPYTIAEMRVKRHAGGTLSAFARIGDVGAWSSEWTIDDGSAQAEAQQFVVEKWRAAERAKGGAK